MDWVKLTVWVGAALFGIACWVALLWLFAYAVTRW
jgi:hypothetical protein